MLYFIVNLTSRTGKSVMVWESVQRYLRDEHITYEAYITEYEGHATELAAMICNKNCEDICLIVVGGDGTMNEVINGMTNFEKVRFGIIPVGSGNDFGNGLGLSSNVSECIKNVLECVKQGPFCYKAIDLGMVSWNQGRNKRLFGISSGLGMDAIVCKKALHSKLKTFLNKIHLGKLTYILLTIQTLFSMRTSDFSVCYDNIGENKREFKKVIFMAAMNLSAEGGGVPMAPKASAYDGNLSVTCASQIPKWLTFFYLPFLVVAKHENIKGFDITETAAISVHVSKPVVLHADGEYCGDVTDVTYTCLAGKLHILI